MACQFSWLHNTLLCVLIPTIPVCLRLPFCIYIISLDDRTLQEKFDAVFSGQPCIIVITVGCDDDIVDDLKEKLIPITE